MGCTSLLVAVCCPLAASAFDETDLSASVRTTTCKAVHGSMIPACNGAICNQGKLTGDLSGRFVSRVTSIYPGGSGWVFTAWTRIDLDHGEGRIETIDRGTVPFDAKGGPDMSRSTEVLSIDAATGSYMDDTGMLIVSGAHQVGRMEAYSGELCHRISE